MTDKSPEQIRREIDVTRAELSGDVQTLTEKVSPKQAMGRQVQRTRDAMAKAKDKVMGSDRDDDGDEGMLSSAMSSVADTAGSVARAAGSVPEAAKKQTQGSPLAAALVAFGAGWVLSALLPASTPEQRLAEQAKDKDAEVAQPVMEQAVDQLRSATGQA